MKLGNPNFTGIPSSTAPSIAARGPRDARCRGFKHATVSRNQHFDSCYSSVFAILHNSDLSVPDIRHCFRVGVIAIVADAIHLFHAVALVSIAFCVKTGGSPLWNGVTTPHPGYTLLRIVRSPL
jgi:hypothetical protein